MSEDTTGPEHGQPSVTGEDHTLSAAKGLVDKGAPWKAGVAWQVVLAQGIVMAVVGAIIWLMPGFGALAVLQLLALLLLVDGGLSVWRLLRDKVAPRRIGTVAFRAGVGMAIGLVVVIGSLIVGDRDVATVAIAIVLGVGLVLYGLSALLAALLRREPGARVPVVGLVVAAAAAVVGVLLVLNGRDGIASLRGTFVVLGILVLLAGLALVGYALLLRSRDETEPEE